LITNLFISEISVEQAEYVHLSAVKYQNTANAKNMMENALIGNNGRGMREK
jgi:hypothetical protein